MKFLSVFLYLILLNCLAFSQGYKLEKSPLSSQVDIFLFSQELNPYNLFPMDLTHKGSILKQDFDQIFFDRNNFNNYAVLKLDLRYLGNHGALKLSETDSVCHGVFIGQRSFSLFTSGIEFKTVEKICHQVNITKNDIKKNHYSKSMIAYELLFKQAQAMTTCSDQQNSKNVTSIKNISTQFSSEATIQKIGTCLANALKGSGQVFTGMLDGVKNLLSFSPREIWKGIKESVEGIKNFVLHIKDEMIKLKNSLSSLNIDLILSIGCTLAGEIITSAGVSALTGAGVAMLSKRIIDVISRIGKLKHLFERLNKLKFLGKGKLAEEVLSCGLK